MKSITIAIGFLLFLPACKVHMHPEQTGSKKVDLEQAEGKYRLYVNGEEFYVKGAGCEFGNIEALSGEGANSFRTWRTENGQSTVEEILDRAQQTGVMVLMGLDVGRERHGCDYNDSVWVGLQHDSIRAQVERIKDHPALLGWVIGNELNLGAQNLKVFDAVNELSKMIHKMDTNHVTTTALSGIGKREVDYIKEHCSDIDFLSIQMYGDIVNLQQRINDAGWEGPYMVTEWGATGHWEVARTEWDAPIEQTSQEKAGAFIERYKKAIAADTMKCLGSYVFLWGQKQERTPTWYGMFLEDGSKTETVDAMHFLWTGEWPDNRCPTLDSLRIERKSAYDNIKLIPGGKFTAEVFARDYENDSLRYVWEIMPESTDLGWGGDHESRPETLWSIEDGAQTNFIAPEVPGAYRLFIYVYDSHQQAATANIPFFVNEQ
jgi:hypothetical protein